MKSEQSHSEPAAHFRAEQALIGYQIAVNLWSARAGELWSQFGAIMTANSIVLAAATISISSPTAPKVLTIGMPIVGITLCFLWAILHVRGVAYTIYWVLSARELEEKYFTDSFNILCRGGAYGDGKPVEVQLDGKKRILQMSPLGRVFPVRWVAYSVIGVFYVMYLGLLANEVFFK